MTKRRKIRMNCPRWEGEAGGVSKAREEWKEGKEDREDRQKKIYTDKQGEMKTKTSRRE